MIVYFFYILVSVAYTNLYLIIYGMIYLYTKYWEGEFQMLEVLNLVKNYKAHQVLDDVSFSLDKGEVCGLIGPNGAGKSTLMKIYMSIRKAESRGCFI